MTRMSGPGDIDGEVSGDEAAWRDLVARFDSPAEQADASSPWPARENIPDPAPKADPVDTQDLPGPLVAGTIQPYDSARVVRQAGDPRAYSPPDETDEPYVPEPLPPPRTLDPIAKAAWLGVIAGPGYLLLASLIMHWTISATEAFVAVAAFIGGFVTLVIKLGDHPRDDDDNGAVL
jgi:hypothetical protein